MSGDLFGILECIFSKLAIRFVSVWHRDAAITNNSEHAQSIVVRLVGLVRLKLPVAVAIHAAHR